MLLNKIKYILGIAVIFVLVLSTNLIDKHNFNRVKDSMKVIYEDRLVANDLLMEISQSLHKKEIALASANNNFFLSVNSNNKIIEESVEGYEVTQMTRDEERLFSDLKSNLELVFKAQSVFIETEFKYKSGLIKALVKADENIYRLGKVQVKEGNRQLAISKKAIDSVELFTQIEIYFLIFLVAIVLFLVIYTPKSKVQSEG